MWKTWLVFAGSLSVLTHAQAQQETACAGPLVGTWQLQSFEVEDLQTHERRALFGQHPSGYATYNADCRTAVLMAKEGRTKAQSLVPNDAERSTLYQGMIMYGGTYRIEGDRVISAVDISWNQAWTGTNHIRQFKIDGDLLTTQTLPAKNSLDGKETVYYNVWRRM